MIDHSRARDTNTCSRFGGAGCLHVTAMLGPWESCFSVGALCLMILAIDIGGTKFSMAVFDGARMVRRESRATDAAGGRDWMLGQIAEIARQWGEEYRFTACGIGFGGPVNFAALRVVLSIHVGGWREFD